jgi:hypothetical protein
VNGAAAAAAERATALRTLVDKVLAGVLCLRCSVSCAPCLDVMYDQFTVSKTQGC